jgi:hypothetical protein
MEATLFGHEKGASTGAVGSHIGLLADGAEHVTNKGHQRPLAVARGKPGEGEGFDDPKGGENWVRNPNGPGMGWESSDGDVWVPTGVGPNAHGGPHWDVQDPKTGKHRNVYPGGGNR